MNTAISIELVPALRGCYVGTVLTKTGTYNIVFDSVLQVANWIERNLKIEGLQG